MGHHFSRSLKCKVASVFRMSVSRQHWKVSLYVAAVIAAAWLWFWSFRLGFRPPEWVAILVLMWIPGLLSILFRVMFREGFADVGWRVGKARFWAWAYLGPLSLATLSVLAAVCSGRVALAPQLSAQTMLDAMVFKLSWLVPNSSSAG